ncbi:hypothetical protein RND81_05G255900 [Saponaria officinalis]|uniref:F-box associated beta-propeller type 1 domain-containing protein n=1 Tax=Saponaria officinalis TaxID=3572 RepID=A0AAW1KWJ8_SAPOF
MIRQGKSLTLPIPVVTCERSCAIGFGFDHHCLDYKVVRIGIILGFNACWADVYVVRAGEWKKVIGSILRPASKITGEGVYMNNSIHWIIKFTKSSNGQNCEEYSILTYNLSTEVFSEMGIREIMGHKFMSLTKLTFNGDEKLVLYHDDQYFDFYVWVMKEYGVVDSWREICILGSKSQDYIKVLHTRKNGEIVFSTTQGGIFSCEIEEDINEKTNVKVIQDHGMQFDYIGPFVRSLVFVEQHCVGLLCDKRISFNDMEEEGEEDYDDKKRKIGKQTSRWVVNKRTIEEVRRQIIELKEDFQEDDYKSDQEDIINIVYHN